MGFFLLIAAGNDSTKATYAAACVADGRPGAAPAPGRGPVARPERRRGVAAVSGVRPLPPHGDVRHRARRKADSGGREGGHVVRVLKPRRVALRGSRPLRRAPQSRAPGLRGGRASLLLLRSRGRILFEETLARYPEMEFAGEPVFVESPFINQLKTLPVRPSPDCTGDSRPLGTSGSRTAARQPVAAGGRANKQVAGRESGAAVSLSPRLGHRRCGSSGPGIAVAEVQRLGVDGHACERRPRLLHRMRWREHRPRLAGDPLQPHNASPAKAAPSSARTTAVTGRMARRVNHPASPGRSSSRGCRSARRRLTLGGRAPPWHCPPPGAVRWRTIAVMNDASAACRFRPAAPRPHARTAASSWRVRAKPTWSMWAWAQHDRLHVLDRSPDGAQRASSCGR